MNFHVKALTSSFIEVGQEALSGFKRFIGSERTGFSDQIYCQAREKLGSVFLSTGRVGEGMVRLFANVSYLVGRPIHDSGEAIGSSIVGCEQK